MTTLRDRARALAGGGPLATAAPPVPVEVKPLPAPPDVKKRIHRVHEGMKQVAPRRRQNVEFARNNHYVWINKKGTGLDRQDTVDRRFGGKKPDHRVRRSHDILAPVLKAKISAATQRIPGYEVLEATSDPEDYSAARVAEKVLVGGYDIWGVRKAFRRAIWDALVTEEAFVMPFFDETIGPYVEEDVVDEQTGEAIFDEEGAPRRKAVAMGEIRYAVFSGLEVGWQPGVQFEDARYYVVVHARPREQVEAEPGFIGGKLEADATISPDFLGEKPKGADSDLVLVTDYMERPCASQPNGRRVIEANGRQIFPEEDYPVIDGRGEIADQPFARRISYAIDGEADHDRGLVTSVIETLRDFDFASNKAVEYLQLVLVPQLMGPVGALKSKPSDAPGDYVEVDDDAWARGEKPEWREMPSMPGEFGNERDRSQALLGYMASETSAVGAESGKQIQALAQKDALAWQDFMEDVADAFAGSGRDSLCIAQVFYDEERMERFRGRTGWESIPDFKGADIRGQVDVRVKVGSLEPLTRSVIEQRIMNVASMFPGYFEPETLIAALSAGDFDRLNESFEEDEAQINFLISQIRAGTFKDLPMRPVLPGEGGPELDPATGQPKIGPDGRPVMLTQIEGWMPRPFDSPAVWKRRLEAFMKSDEWRYLGPEVQQATGFIYNAVLQIEARNAAKQAAIQAQTAEALGTQNAAKPQGPKPMPSLPAAPAPEGAPAAGG
jgi:hypothetical protein